ncbi:hypothetical protein GCM10020331_028320 [Ectobacillus funiculus]
MYAPRSEKKGFFIVSDLGVAQAGWLERVMDCCRLAGLPFATFMDIATNPRDTDVVNGCTSFIENECDAVIGVGGAGVR